MSDRNWVGVELNVNTDWQTPNGHNEMISVCLSQWSVNPLQSHVISPWLTSSCLTSTMVASVNILLFSKFITHSLGRSWGNIFKLMNLKYGYWFLKDYNFVFLARRFSSNNSKYHRHSFYRGDGLKSEALLSYSILTKTVLNLIGHGHSGIIML